MQKKKDSTVVIVLNTEDLPHNFNLNWKEIYIYQSHSAKPNPLAVNSQ